MRSTASASITSYHFSASHRLYSANFSEAENKRLYGKCSNPFGHGHNYTLEVLLTGPVDSDTGMIANLADLDAFVDREVIQDFDHRYLNEEIPVFSCTVPTTENVCSEIHQRLAAFPYAHLERIKIEETSNNSFEYYEDVADEASAVPQLSEAREGAN